MYLLFRHSKVKNLNEEDKTIDEEQTLALVNLNSLKKISYSKQYKSNPEIKTIKYKVAFLKGFASSLGLLYSNTETS